MLQSGTMDLTQDRLTLEKNLSFVMGRPLALAGRDIGLFSDETIKQAYRARAKELHPDRALILGRNPDALAEQFRELRDAYELVVESRKTGEFFRLLSQPAYRTPYRKPYTARPAHPCGTKPGTHATNKTHATATVAKMFHAGKIPLYRLRLAQYLYYSKRIDWKTLIDAITWQYRVRPKLGTLALEKGYMNHEDILKTLGSKTADELFGAVALRLGILTPYRLSILVGHQRLLNLPIGRFFIDNGYLSPDELDECLASLAHHNFGLPKLGVY